MKVFQKDELKILGPFYLEKFISHLLYFLPAFWIISFNNYITLTQIGIIFSVMSILSFLFEIPTGAFADIYGRKASTLVGYFFSAISLFFLFFFKNFMGILIFTSLWSIAGTFVSGAKESWIIDNIKRKTKKSSLIKSFFLKEQFIVGLSLFFSGILGTFVVKQVGLEIIWIFASASFLSTFIILLLIPEIKKKTRAQKLTFKLLFKQSKDSIKYSLKHPILFYILIASFFIILRETFGGDINEQAFLKLIGLPIPLFGVFFSAISLMMILAPLVSGFMLKRFKSEKKILSWILILCIPLDIAILFSNSIYLAIPLILVIIFLIFLFQPINQIYIQKNIPPRMRATIISFMGMVISLAYIIGSPLAGFFGDLIGPQKTIVLGAVFLIPALILYLKIKDKK